MADRKNVKFLAGAATLAAVDGQKMDLIDFFNIFMRAGRIEYILIHAVT